MKKYTVTTLFTIITGTALLFPVGLALAESGTGLALQGNAGVGIHVGGSGEGGDAHGEDVSGNSAIHIDMEGGENGTSSAPFMRGEKDGLLKHFGTTTPPGMRNHHEATSTDEASSSEGRDAHGKGGAGIRAGLTGFFQWLFGLPASTTIGDIRTQLNASTTASSSINLGAEQSGGFFKHLGDFFGGLFGGHVEN